MAAYYKRLKKDLDGAAADGIISPEQADKIFERASAGSLFGRLRAVHWIAAAAGLFIALGVLLVVAHNWDKLGAGLKIGAFLLILAGVAEGSVSSEEKPVVAVPLETLWFFMPIIGIGLYAQIFNLSGDPVKPYLAWAALSAPLAFLSKRNIAAYLVSLLLFAVLYWGTLGQNNMLALTAGYNRPEQPWTHWALALGVLAGGTFTYLFKAGRGRGLALGAGLAWLFLMLCADTALKLHSPAMLLLAGMSAAALWLAWDSEGEEASKLPLTAWTGAGYAMTFFWHYRPYAESCRADSPAGAVAAWVLFAAALSSIILRPQRVLPPGAKEDLLGKGLLAASVLCAFLLFDAGQAPAKILAVTANIILAALGAGLIISGAKTSCEKTINRGVAVLTLTAITRFVDIFGGLLRSGLAFIVTGLAFAALAYFVNRGRKALIDSVTK